MDEFNDSTRRRLFGSGAALALSGLAAGSAAAQPTPAVVSIKRGRYGISADFYPTYNTVTVVPFDVTYFQETADWTLRPDGKILINTTGLYRVVLAMDWVAQAGVDIDLRIYGVMCTRVKTARRKRPPTPFGDDRICWFDLPGSNPPKTLRSQTTWAPGFIPQGGIVTTEVTFPAPVLLTLGDIAFASHTQIADGVIGADAVNALSVQAKVVGQNRVRVCLYNPLIAGGITVPEGLLNVTAMSSILTCGENDDSLTSLQSPTELFKAGDVVYGVIRSHTRNDYIQANQDCYIQMERVG